MVSKWGVKVLIGFGEVLIHSIYNSQLTIFLKEIQKGFITIIYWTLDL